ncbi:unnamed protein product [Protopolystoma xenopodis]|uniref:Uncharacterized protein n=1 Tax=Protopolystoma xenopodis TaxID=117903 RepID=A0A3S5BB49_9PLAT|nr:unnamed protein product [Protopolystoma xenopodis]
MCLFNEQFVDTLLLALRCLTPDCLVPFRALTCFFHLLFGLFVSAAAGNFGTVFVDQSYWQVSTTTKPYQGVLGYLIGGLIWFIIPLSFGTSNGLAYLGLGVLNGTDLLTPSDIGKGTCPLTPFPFHEDGRVV